MTHDSLSPLVSVIVPTYNNEAQIAGTLRSIVAQDYPNIEIIVVNDASDDATEETARSVLHECGRRVSIIRHSENRGVSSARNTGLDAAEGEYVWFCDGDDLVERNFVSTLAGLCLRHECDIACCGITDRFTDGSPDRPHPLRGPSFLDGETMTWKRTLKEIEPDFCCTLLKRALLTGTGLRFSDGCTAGEDVEFQIKAFCRAKKVAITPECLYNYVHHPGMGQVRDKDSKEKILRRYAHNTEAHFRTAEYLIRHAPSDRVKSLGEALLLPEASVRRLTLYAKAGDRAAFDAFLSSAGTRRALRRSGRFFFQKPELFLKAFALLHFPGLYYRARSRA